MNVFEDLDYLGHDDYFLYYFLYDLGYFDDPLLSDQNWVQIPLDDPIYDLQGVLDQMNVVGDLLESLNDNLLLNGPIDLFDLCVLCFDDDYLLYLNLDLSQLLDQNWDLDDLLDYVLNVPVDPYDLGHYLLHLNYFGHVHPFLYDSLHLVHFRDVGDPVHHLLYYLLDLLDFLDNSLHRYNLLSPSLHLHDPVLNVRHDFLHLLKSLLNYHVVHFPLHLNHFYHLLLYRHDPVSILIDLLYLPMHHLDRNHFLYYPIHRNLDLHWNYHVSRYLNYPRLLDDVSYYLLNLKRPWDLSGLDNDSL